MPFRPVPTGAVRRGDGTFTTAAGFDVAEFATLKHLQRGRHGPGMVVLRHSRADRAAGFKNGSKLHLSTTHQRPWLTRRLQLSARSPPVRGARTNEHGPLCNAWTSAAVAGRPMCQATPPSAVKGRRALRLYEMLWNSESTIPQQALPVWSQNGPPKEPYGELTAAWRPVWSPVFLSVLRCSGDRGLREGYFRLYKRARCPVLVARSSTASSLSRCLASEQLRGHRVKHKRKKP
ncbi:hypothetical protein BC834DRAFT_850642, partial [Gloeopeniophorella convolvens]